MQSTEAMGSTLLRFGPWNGERGDVERLTGSANELGGWVGPPWPPWGEATENMLLAFGPWCGRRT